MNYSLEIQIDESAVLPRLVIYTAQITAEVTQLANQLRRGSEQRLLGYREDETVLLEPADIYSFFTQGQTVQARTKLGTLRVRQRLYELEELLPKADFMRISHSEIVNFKNVKSFEVSISGTINLKFRNGEYAYVSRRNVKAIKDYLGL
jgi:DNA-binding LytR/AlgR family response regulator